MFRELAMIVFVTFCTLGSQLLVKHSVTRIAAREPAPSGIEWLITAMTSPGVIAAVLIQGIGFTVWVVVVSRVKLGIAFATSGAFFYILLAVLSWYFYGERLAGPQWLGILLVSSGVLLISLSGRSA